jgi:hypothetical protein
VAEDKRADMRKSVFRFYFHHKNRKRSITFFVKKRKFLLVIYTFWRWAMRSLDTVVYPIVNNIFTQRITDHILDEKFQFSPAVSSCKVDSSGNSWAYFRWVGKSYGTEDVIIVFIREKWIEIELRPHHPVTNSYNHRTFEFSNVSEFENAYDSMVTEVLKLLGKTI